MRREALRHLHRCHACEGRHPVSAGACGVAKVTLRRGALAAMTRSEPNRSGLLVPGLRLRRNRDDTRCVGARGRVLTAALETNRPRISRCSSGVTAEGMRGRATLSGRHPVQGAAATRHPLAPLASVRREALRHLHSCHTCEGRHPVSAGACGFAKADASRRRAFAAVTRSEPNRSGVLDPGLRLRRNRDDTRCVGARGRVLAAALETNRPRISRCSSGVVRLKRC
ncbi:hypothetical protein SAMN05421512_11596 [Stappia indica]|uniref:Uncharacterized protein n=1 Tax=Stappia indica TaxID=538381 RepID=A0A285TSW9_9HYPH|nr:hypothetical protein SAMN05421512_11596 [Stappia indica]